MKKYIIVIIAIMMCGALLAGCEKTDPKLIKEQEYEYTHIDVIFKGICEEHTPIGDWSFGTGNENAHGTRFKKDCPIFTIFVNPFATDEVINLYVQNLLIMDRHMAANKPYMKYIRKEAPYTVSFECMGEELFRVDLDGTVEHDRIFNMLKESIVSPHETAAAKLEEFNRFLASDNDILRGPDGDLYFLLDSKNLSDSLDEVLPKVDRLIEVYPFPRETVEGWYGSFDYLGTPGGTYQFYFDEYGNDPLFPGDYFSFAIPSNLIYNSAYSHFVPVGNFEDEKAEVYYYCNVYTDGKINVFGGYNYIHNENNYVDEESVCNVLYDLYDSIITAHEEHGIRPLADLELSGEGLTNERDERDDPIGLTTKAVIPMDERISKEEFDALILAGTQTYKLSDRQLPDDCF